MVATVVVVVGATNVLVTTQVPMPPAPNSIVPSPDSAAPSHSIVVR